MNEIIELYSGGREYSVANKLELESINGNTIYFYYELYPYGYIVLNEQNILMEANFEVKGFASEFGPDKTYYGGPLIFLKKRQENYISIVDGYTLNEAELIECKKQVARCEAILMMETNNQRVSGYGGGVNIRVEESYFSNLTAFGTNVNGTCTVLASAILFGYYNNFVSTNFVPTNMRDGNGTSEAFHQYLNGYVYGSNPQAAIGIYYAKSGLNNYLASRGNTQRMYSKHYADYGSGLYTSMENYLNSNMPLIASMNTANGANWNHTCVVYGMTYAYAAPTASKVFVAHMGWHSDTHYNHYLFNHAWIYEFGYVI